MHSWQLEGRLVQQCARKVCPCKQQLYQCNFEQLQASGSSCAGLLMVPACVQQSQLDVLYSLACQVDHSRLSIYNAVFQSRLGSAKLQLKSKQLCSPGPHELLKAAHVVLAPPLPRDAVCPVMNSVRFLRGTIATHCKHFNVVGCLRRPIRMVI